MAAPVIVEGNLNPPIPSARFDAVMTKMFSLAQ